ncbi:hypothetical protein GCM10023224_42770 [Streptomonospora halophila]|uniref:Uncharacterized protein n=1 Tax=Streptomonospora halophila TaxID=427369 RepID=A0ABP9GUG2_9ACTN
MPRGTGAAQATSCPGEAQTLPSGAEADLPKLGELRGTLTPEEAERWKGVKALPARQGAGR